MDVQIAVALDSPPQQRDFEIEAGDDYRVIVKVFADEADTTVDPVSLAGMTLTFEQVCYPGVVATAVGNTFTFQPGKPAYVCARTPYRVVSTDANGLRTTLFYGNVIMRGACWRNGGLWGITGSDYGFFV